MSATIKQLHCVVAFFILEKIGLRLPHLLPRILYDLDFLYIFISEQSLNRLNLVNQ